MLDEKCPNCSSEEYEIDDFWDDFDENDGIRVWNCICSSCHKKFNIMHIYTFVRTEVEVSES